MRVAIPTTTLERPGAARSGGGMAAVGSVVLAGVLFGTAGTAQAIGPAATTPLGVGTMRLLGGGAILLAAIVVLGGQPNAALRILRTRWGVLAGCCSAAYQICFFGSVELTGVAMGTLVTVSSAPVLAGALSWAVLNDRPRRGWAIATAVCIAGLTLLSADGLRGSPVGVLLAFGAGCAMAVYNVAAKRLMDRGSAILDILAGTFLLGGLLLIPLFIAQPLGWLLTPEGLLLAVYLGGATMALANTFMAFGLRRLRPGPVTTLTLADPLTATVLGFMILGETLSILAVLGLVLVVVGLLMQGAASTRRRRAKVRPLLAIF